MSAQSDILMWDDICFARAPAIPEAPPPLSDQNAISVSEARYSWRNKVAQTLWSKKS